MKTVLALLLFCGSLGAQVTCYAVSPSGAGSANGSSWSNAYAGLPSTLVRGAIYYLADGNYGHKLTLNTAVSGTATIELRKAQSYDYGNNSATCSNSGAIVTGWNAGTMGAAQAVWTWGSAGSMVNIGSGYWTINGNGNGASTEIGCGGVYENPPATMTGPAPNPAACGIKIDASTCTATANNGCDNGSGEMHGAGPNITWESVEWEGQGLNPNGNNNSETYFWFATATTNMVVTHSYLHNASTTYITNASGGWNNATVSYNYMWGLFDGSLNHGEALQDTGTDSGTVIHHNVFRDHVTNGDLVFVDPVTGTHSNFEFYDNLDFCTTVGNCRHNDGIIACINSSQTCTGFVVYNNTIVGVTNNSGFVSTNTAGMTVQNNLWYNCAGVSFSGGGYVEDYNSCLASGSGCGLGGAHDVTASASGNPFVSYVNSASSFNFNIASENSNWNNRLALASPYNIDIAGNTFTTDRGAYQFASNVCSVTPTSMGPITAGQSISQQLTASNCNAGTFTISSGSLSGSGLTLSPGGMVTGSALAGSFNFTIAYSTATDPISLTINAAPSITTSSLPAGQVNGSYSQHLSSSGGTGAIACALTSGALPTGLTLSACTISGTPTIASTYSFSVTPTDASGISGSAQALSILISPANTSTPVILHTTFCGPGVSWPGTCTLSTPTTAGTRLVVVYSSYNSAGSTPVMNSITDGGDTFSQLPNARSTNTSSATSWNDVWSASPVAGGVTALTITPSTTELGDVYVWEVQYASNVVGCASLNSQPAANPAVGASTTAGAAAILLAHLHPAPGGLPTAVSSPFTSDTISDQMAYAHYTAPSSGAYAPQWTQTAATFAADTCAFSPSGTQPNPATSPIAIVH